MRVNQTHARTIVSRASSLIIKILTKLKTRTQTLKLITNIQ